MSRFDEEAKLWDKRKRRYKVAKSVVDNIIKNIELKNEFCVLDYGCGTGLVAYQLLDFVDNLMGMDSSPKMLEEFLLKDSKGKKVSAMIHNIDTQKLPVDSFDLIVSSMTMHHIENVNNFFNEANSALKEGGFLVIADLDLEDGTFHDKGNDGVMHFGFEKREIEELYNLNGFEFINYEIVFSIEKNDKSYKIFTAIGKKR